MKIENVMINNNAKMHKINIQKYEVHMHSCAYAIRHTEKHGIICNKRISILHFKFFTVISEKQYVEHFS